ncbi:AcrR family transcriptional regulator [Spinactinospora alkalitolerans]|uniref:AcrR family transcriptional regulator n=1 Tax=Spinactinospora alkalitolerans TaxID=687207 RepID=A0A852TQ17_9ACTN|nr:TetR family transcriptional regulator [Spinactinospora alkalitolerans]NYE46476.1 AcrR family transcriptional regulator [Spinactinospora alkalitolerans]
MSASTTRDRILDALQDILIEEGSSAVTLEAVAAAAGVSKGGLLYHFPSKTAMMTGLVRRLADRAEEEFGEAVETEGGVVRGFLRTSLPESSEEAALYWSIIAALRSKEDVSEEARRLIHHVFAQWSELLHQEIDDPVLAETIRLVGDGLYLTAIAGLPQPDPEVVRRMMDRLIEQADACRRT